MVRARFTGVNHYHEGEQLDEGDVVELTEEQYEQWSYQFVRLDEAANAEPAAATAPEQEPGPAEASGEGEGEAETQAEAEPDTSAEQAGSEAEPTEAEAESAASEADVEEPPAGEPVAEFPDVLDQPVTDLREELATGEYDDRLDELAVLEAQRENSRTTALDAIESRQDQAETQE